MKTPKIALIGTGNVGFHFAQRLSTQGCPPRYVIGSSAQKSEDLIKSLRLTSESPDGPDLSSLELDFVILTVSDAQVSVASSMFKFPKGAIILHTSGSQPMDLLSPHSSFGVVYPLQTFSKEKTIDFDKIPILIEGSDPDTLAKISFLAKLLSPDVRPIGTAQRQKIHLAAVFACNFTNTLYQAAEKILNNTGLKISDLQHLMEETVTKAIDLGATEAQTGPAARGDQEVIERHLNLLINEPDMKEVYEMMTRRIQASKSAK